MKEKPEEDDNSWIVGSELLGKRITDVNFSMGRTNHRSIGIHVPFRVRNALAGMLEQMRKEDGRQGEYQRCQPDDRKTDDDQFGPRATNK